MLTDKQINDLAQPIIDIYSKMELDLLLWIAERFASYDYVGGDLEWKLKELSKMGALDERALRIIADNTNIALEEVKKAITQAGIQSIDFKTYEKAYDLGQAVVNVNNINLKPIAKAVYGEVEKELVTVHQEISPNVTREYRKIIDQINLETSTGIYDFDTSYRKSLSRLADKGITSQTYHRTIKDRKGNKVLIPVEYSIESVARRSVNSAITRSANAHNEEVGKVIEAKYWATSQHLGARNKGQGHQNHEAWQGTYHEEEKFRKVTGEGEVDGLGGANCRHIKFAYFPGISPKLEKLYNADENDRIVKLFEKQRYNERKIRAAKKELEMAKETGDKEFIKQASKKLKNRQSKQKEYVDSHPELKRDYSRESISSPTEIKQKINSDNFNDTTEKWLSEIDETKEGKVVKGSSYESNGIIYDLSNAKMQFDYGVNEISMANWLKEKFHEDVELVPITAPLGKPTISTPDFIFKGEKWDLKTPTKNSDNTIRDLVKKAKRKNGVIQSNNFVIDVSVIGYSSDVDKKINNLFKHYNTDFVNKVIVYENGKLISIKEKKR